MTIDHTDEDVLRELYWEEGLSTKEIANRSNASCSSTIRYHMKKNGVRRKTPTYKKYEDAEWKDKNLIRELYWDKNLSTYEIADKVGCDENTILRFMKNNDIERRVSFRNRHPGVHESGNYMRIKHWDADGERKEVAHHRLIAVAIYGIDAVKNMHVHHRSGHGLDNRHENLELMTPSDHLKHHAEQRSDSQIT